jgi:hypothetical protein
MRLAKARPTITRIVAAITITIPVVLPLFPFWLDTSNNKKLYFICQMVAKALAICECIVVICCYLRQILSTKELNSNYQSMVVLTLTCVFQAVVIVLELALALAKQSSAALYLSVVSRSSYYRTRTEPTTVACCSCRRNGPFFWTRNSCSVEKYLSLDRSTCCIHATADRSQLHHGTHTRDLGHSPEFIRERNPTRWPCTGHG